MRELRPVVWMVMASGTASTLVAAFLSISSMLFFMLAPPSVYDTFGQYLSQTLPLLLGFGTLAASVAAIPSLVLGAIVGACIGLTRLDEVAERAAQVRRTRRNAALGSVAVWLAAVLPFSLVVNWSARIDYTYPLWAALIPVTIGVLGVALIAWFYAPRYVRYVLGKSKRKNDASLHLAAPNMPLEAASGTTGNYQDSDSRVAAKAVSTRSMP